jgi:hypothetical protein
MANNPVTTPITAYVIAFGNAFDGIELFGPFNTSDAAREYAEENMMDDWSITPVYAHMAGDEP